MLFTKNNSLWNERKEDYLHVMSKEVENRIFRHNHIFRLNPCRSNPCRQSSGIIIFLCKHYIVLSAPGCAFCWSNQEGKIELLYCTSPFLLEWLNLLPNFQKGRGAWQGSFYIKNELKSEIFNGKKVYKQKCFSLS